MAEVLRNHHPPKSYVPKWKGVVPLSLEKRRASNLAEKSGSLFFTSINDGKEELSMRTGVNQVHPRGLPICSEQESQALLCHPENEDEVSESNLHCRESVNMKRGSKMNCYPKDKRKGI